MTFEEANEIYWKGHKGIDTLYVDDFNTARYLFDVPQSPQCPNCKHFDECGYVLYNKLSTNCRFYELEEKE